MDFIKFLLPLAIIGFLAWLVLRKFKNAQIGALTLIDGGVKSGKTTFAVANAIKIYRLNRLKWRVAMIFCKIFRRPLPEEPRLYSNIPIALKEGYYPVTQALLERNERTTYKSVVLLSEASLVADNQLYKDEKATEQIMLFCKLFGHSTRGGTCIIDTQAIGDLSVAVRRCISNTFYIHHLVKIPFFIIAYVIEERYTEDGSSSQINTGDVADNLKKVLISKSVWRKFDCYCYEHLTRNCKKQSKPRFADRKDLQAYDIVSFRNYKELKK